MAEENKLNSALISASTSFATAEGLTDEEQIAVRAQELYEDAKKDQPETELGKKVRERANELVAVQATGVASPYAGKPKFDYDKLRNETAIPAMESIMKKMAEHAAFLPIPTNNTPEYEKECEKAYQQFSIETFRILNTNKVAMSQYKYVFESLKAIIDSLEELCMKQVIGHRHEIISRFYGAKNPGTEKFDANYATYENLIEALEHARKNTGGNLDDYFNRTSIEEN